MAKFLRASGPRIAAYIDLPDSPYHGVLGTKGELSGEVRALHLATGRRIWAVDTAVRDVVPDTIPQEWENSPGKHRQGELVNTKLGPATVTGGPVQTPLGIVYRVKLDSSGNEFDTWEHEMSPANQATHSIVQASEVRSMLSYPEVGEVAGDGCSVAEDDDGVYVKTHRSRSKSYPSFEDIPKKEVDQVATTASVKTAAPKFKIGDSVEVIYSGERRARDYGVIKKVNTYGGRVWYTVHSTPREVDIALQEHEVFPMAPVSIPDSPAGWTEDTPAQVEDMVRNASEEKDPDHSFVYYKGQLKLVEWSHTNRHRQILKDLLGENGKELVDDIDDTDIVAGTVTDGEVEFEGFAEPELREEAEKAISEEISGSKSEEPKAEDAPKEITININIDGWSEKS